MGNSIYTENKKDIRKNYIGSLRIQVKGKEVPKFKDKETFPVETVFLEKRSERRICFLCSRGNDRWEIQDILSKKWLL